MDASEAYTSGYSGFGIARRQPKLVSVQAHKVNLVERSRLLAVTLEQGLALADGHGVTHRKVETSEIHQKGSMSHPYTIREIARQAGVSEATVDRRPQPPRRRAPEHRQ